MCGPVAVVAAMAVLAIASSVASYVGQKEQAESNVHFANMDKANRFNVREQQRTEQDQQSAENRLQIAVQAAQAQGRIVNSASVGLGPQTTKAYMNASAVATGRATGLEALNFRFQRAQGWADNQADELRRINQIRQVPMPSKGALAIDIAGDVVNAFSTGYGGGAIGGKSAGGGMSAQLNG